MLRSLYDWTLEKAEHPHALWIMALLSFAESSFFPIPPDVLLIPMVLAAPTRAWRIAFVCSFSSLFGGLLGYYIGYALFGSIGQSIVDFYHMQDQFEHFKQLYNAHGAIIVAMAGFTPIPYKVFTIASGLTHLDLTTFIVASVLSRSARFFLVAALLRKYGAPIREFIEKRLGMLTLLFFTLLVGSYLAIRYL